MSPETANIVKIIVVCIGYILAFILGRKLQGKVKGYIVVQESPDPDYTGKVSMIFDDGIDSLINSKRVVLKVRNELPKKYNPNNGDQ